MAENKFEKAIKKNNDDTLKSINKKNNKGAIQSVNKKSRGKVFKSFLIGFGITISFLLVVFIAAAVLYNKFLYKNVDNLGFNTNQGKVFIDPSTSLIDSSATPNKSTKTTYNFAILGTDEVGASDDMARTDFIMIGQYNTKTNKMSLMSVPRDTRITVPPDRLKIMKNSLPKELWPRSSGDIKINQVYHFAPKDDKVAFTLAQLEETFQVDFDFYVKFDLSGFDYIVDKIGGVPFNVPQRMYYNDPQQGLHIDLQPGQQVLNGKNAEGLVRYRESDINNPISKPLNGDLGRIEIQQNFINAFLTKLASTNNLAITIPAIFTAGAKYVDTNIKITDIPIFIPFLNSYSKDNLNLYVMPNDVASVHGESMVEMIQPDTDNMINKIFYPNEIGKVEVLSSKNQKISILNASSTSGVASKTASKLKEDGYNVVNMANYDGDKLDKTQIIVKNSKYGKDLKAYFKSAEIKVDSSIDNDIEIRIGETGLK